MTTYENMSYDKFLVLAVKNGFLPMYGCNFQDPVSKKMEHEYHISAHLDKGLFLTSESQYNTLHEAVIYYELNTSKSDKDSTTVDRILDILTETNNVSCAINTESTFAIKYHVENELVSHLNRLNHKGVWTNNPWKHLDKHCIDIIQFDEDKLKLPGYHTSNNWIKDMPDAVKYLIGYKK